ncbi:hypothetical protein EPUS_00880 [Endocarpon pusillum Z07020]|uniref:DUF1776-domain-containing protein n=1 Tax=Endocarpon pusillum (strain Z07020 / HMAS-L-300199) TaxID=1263415 RepID=U1G883_ENDPU|nr:uncharacterized protein EPUS_00880 [Endocarpon pusillum Z07020]ERF73627.1 hypothetical protein EPUS_00880 [Endocarpon pusillum Z07020]
MTSDDQYFLDLLASVPSDIASYGSRIADYIEKHSSSLATELRDAIDSATWIPDSMRPPVRAVSHQLSAPAPPQGFFARTTTWISNNRTAIAVVLAFAGTTAILIHRRKRAHAKKRRARRDRNGKKKEIVVLACSSFHDPLTHSLALDLDRRGYIVYVTVSSTEEDSLVQSESKWDIRPLWMDLTSSVPNPGLDLHPNLEPIRQLIKPSSRASSPGSVKSSQSNSPSFPHTLAGLILLPGSTGYPTGPLAALPPTDLIDTVNTRLLSPMLTVQQFLPLLALAETQAQSSTAISTTKAAGLPLPVPSVILAYSSIPTSLHPPHQIPETVTTTSLSSFTRCFRHELHPKSNISITELKLGFFDLSSVLPRAPRAGDYVYPQYIREREQGQERSGPEVPRNSALTHWHSSQRAAAHRSIHGQQQEGSDSGNHSKIRGAGSNLREFHNAVFDTLNPSPGFKAFGVVSWGGSRRRRVQGTVYVGQGARLYDFVGKWIPEGLAGWLIRRQERRRGEVEDSSQGTGRSNVDGASERGQETGLPRWGASSASSGSGVWEKL